MVPRLSISTLFDSLLPNTCLLCGIRSEQTLCADCNADLPLLAEPACPRCAAPLGFAASACGACLSHPPAFDATQATLRYAFPVDRLVQSLKFNHRLAIADFFAARMLAGLIPAGNVLVPVPLSRRRLAERGFNQALEIARPLARATGMTLDPASLMRVRETPPQSRLPWHARQRNVRHAFACREDYSGRSVVVIDDVMTTGATLDAVARKLKDHGAASVTNWVAVRAVRTAPSAT